MKNSLTHETIFGGKYDMNIMTFEEMENISKKKDRWETVCSAPDLNTAWSEYGDSSLDLSVNPDMEAEIFENQEYFGGEGLVNGMTLEELESQGSYLLETSEFQKSSINRDSRGPSYFRSNPNLERGKKVIYKRLHDWNHKLDHDGKMSKLISAAKGKIAPKTLRAKARNKTRQSEWRKQAKKLQNHLDRMAA